MGTQKIKNCLLKIKSIIHDALIMLLFGTGHKTLLASKELQIDLRDWCSTVHNHLNRIVHESDEETDGQESDLCAKVLRDVPAFKAEALRDANFGVQV